jgi:hypothetical protein
MDRLVLVLLAVLWGSILVPGAIRGRHDRSPASSIDSFERSMGILASEARGRFAQASPPGRHVLVVHNPQRLMAGRSPRSRTLARRRLILQGLGAAVAVSAVAALVAGGALVWLLVTTLGALAAYVGLLLQIKAGAARTRRVVRRLPVDDVAAGPVEQAQAQRIATGA